MQILETKYSKHFTDSFLSMGGKGRKGFVLLFVMWFTLDFFFPNRLLRRFSYEFHGQVLRKIKELKFEDSSSLLKRNSLNEICSN